MQLTVNGKPIEIDADPDMPLLWALRDLAGITGPKFGCGVAACSRGIADTPDSARPVEGSPRGAAGRPHPQATTNSSQEQ